MGVGEIQTSNHAEALPAVALKLQAGASFGAEGLTRTCMKKHIRCVNDPSIALNQRHIRQTTNDEYIKKSVSASAVHGCDRAQVDVVLVIRTTSSYVANGEGSQRSTAHRCMYTTMAV